MRVLSSWREHQYTRALKVSLLTIRMCELILSLNEHHIHPYLPLLYTPILTGPVRPWSLLLPASEDAALPTELSVRYILYYVYNVHMCVLIY